MNMNISQNGINDIKFYEGFKADAYKPVSQEKYFTIGYGHSGADVTATMHISEQQGEQFLRNDLKIAINTINTLVKVPLNQNEFDSLVSFVFNVGSTNFRTSTMLQLLNNKNYADAANEFPKWVHGDNRQVLPGLVTRRNKERALFLQPVPASHPNQPIKKVIPTQLYRVNYGDTLSQIAVKFNTNVTYLMSINPSIKNQNLIFKGQLIKVPK